MHIPIFSLWFLFTNISQFLSGPVQKKSSRIKELKAELEELEKLKDKDFAGAEVTDGFGWLGTSTQTSGRNRSDNAGIAPR